MLKQRQKALAFRALHTRGPAFVMPNPWDAGSAKLLAALGFPALASTSAGLAFSLAKRDGAGLIDRAQTLSQQDLLATAERFCSHVV